MHTKYFQIQRILFLHTILLQHNCLLKGKIFATSKLKGKQTYTGRFESFVEFI